MKTGGLFTMGKQLPAVAVLVTRLTLNLFLMTEMNSGGLKTPIYMLLSKLKKIIIYITYNILLSSQ